MKIPKRFKLFNHEYIVKFEDDLQKDKDIWGECRMRRQEIALDSNIKQSFLEQTFCHELVHLIFDSLSERELSSNEKLVNTFSELLYQALETMEYEK